MKVKSKCKITWKKTHNLLFKLFFASDFLSSIQVFYVSDPVKQI